jgi:hypothetical protein
MLSRVFQEKRLVASLFMMWGLFVLSIFAYTGVLNSVFVRFGPSAKLKFLDFSIDTWTKWLCVAAFTVIDSIIWQFAFEAIHPWEINTILDPKTKTIPYSKPVCILILESYYLHGVILGPFSFWISLTQLDFVIMKGMAIMMIRTYSHYQYIKDKEWVECEYI